VPEPATATKTETEQESEQKQDQKKAELEPTFGPMPRFKNVIYMADADSVQMTEQAVYAHMRAPHNSETHFYQLSLNDRAEVGEMNGWYLAPKGSLLIWIDQMFASTPSLPDQRAGKLLNQMFAAHRVPEELRNRVHYKSFEFDSYSPDINPFMHGQFSDGLFWRETYFVPRPLPERLAGRGDGE
jgi:hypothetical protein